MSAPRPDLPVEEQLRAGGYSLLARLLAAPPDAETLACLCAIETGETPPQDAMASAWRTLKQAAEHAVQGTLEDEYQALFIGLGRGELVPYGSWYRTGFLMEKPLGNLRRDLAALGFERQAGVHEPEDHAAALCQVMALLILESDMDTQRWFFAAHLEPWLEKFFEDLEKAPSARFYRAVGCLGNAFIDLEKRYLAMPV